ncbi:MAG: 4Fe-4S dicluster domain-containing protein, partial [Clostridia bacterium]|nr:4Fe-4S dicluster domain-containing protein [Clostridia bacterium]
DASPASYAIRFAAGLENVAAVLSGMGNMAMIKDNVSHMKNFKPLNDRENAAIERVREVFKSMELVPCTGCGYCAENCPAGVKIPQIFACLNSKTVFNNWNSSYYYQTSTASGGKASDCLECGSCEEICPQHLEIREFLKQAKETFEKR